MYLGLRCCRLAHMFVRAYHEALFGNNFQRQVLDGELAVFRTSFLAVGTEFAPCKWKPRAGIRPTLARLTTGACHRGQGQRALVFEGSHTSHPLTQCRPWADWTLHGSFFKWGLLGGGSFHAFCPESVYFLLSEKRSFFGSHGSRSRHMLLGVCSPWGDCMWGSRTTVCVERPPAPLSSCTWGCVNVPNVPRSRSVDHGWYSWSSPMERCGGDRAASSCPAWRQALVGF